MPRVFPIKHTSTLRTSISHPEKKAEFEFYGFESARWILKANLRQLITNDGYCCRAIFTAKKIFVMTFSSYLIYFSIVLKMMKLSCEWRGEISKTAIRITFNWLNTHVHWILKIHVNRWSIARLQLWFCELK